jgi:hypothetical protein
MPPKKSIVNFNNYKALASASKFGVKKRVNTIINLYNDRKIYNVKTALNLLNQLTDKKKKNVDIGIKRYNEALQKFQNAEPLNARHQRIRQEKVERKVTERKEKFKGVLREMIGNVEKKNKYKDVLGELIQKTDRNNKYNQLQRVLKDSKKLKANLKIQNMFRNTLVFDIVQTESAMDKKGSFLYTKTSKDRDEHIH